MADWESFLVFDLTENLGTVDRWFYVRRNGIETRKNLTIVLDSLLFEWLFVLYVLCVNGSVRLTTEQSHFLSTAEELPFLTVNVNLGIVTVQYYSILIKFLFLIIAGFIQSLSAAKKYMWCVQTAVSVHCKRGGLPINSVNSRPRNCKQILFKVWQSDRCWFITNIWKSDHCLNMTFGTDIKFTLSFLAAKSLCWWNYWKWILSYFKTQKLETRTIWIQLGLH